MASQSKLKFNTGMARRLISDRVSMSLLLSLTCVTTGSIGFIAYHRYYYPEEHEKFVVGNRKALENVVMMSREEHDQNRWNWNGTGIKDSIPTFITDFFTLSNVAERVAAKRVERKAEIDEIIDNHRRQQD